MKIIAIEEAFSVAGIPTIADLREGELIAIGDKAFGHRVERMPNSSSSACRT